MGLLVGALWFDIGAYQTFHAVCVFQCGQNVVNTYSPQANDIYGLLFFMATFTPYVSLHCDVIFDTSCIGYHHHINGVLVHSRFCRFRSQGNAVYTFPDIYNMMCKERASGMYR